MAMEVAGAVRNAYNAEGRMFVVAGQTLYQITPGGVSVPLGTIPGVGRVSFSHNQITNGNEILINNGNAGYIYNTVTQVFQRITDTSYPGGLRAVFINNRFVQIEPARRYVFNSDLADGLNYNALDRFTSETSPDLVMGIESIGNQLAVFSSTTTEWFEDTGANPQPFRSTGIVADKGAAGPFCTAKLDNQLFFLADDGVFYRYQGYNPVRISTKPIEQSIRNKNWFNAFTTVWEDSGYAVCYWTFPDGLTWGYDASTGKWHRRESYGFNRWRLNSLTYWQNKWYGGDFQAGKLYELDWDYILEGDQEFVSYRSAGAISDNQNRVIHERLELVMNTGMRATVPIEFANQPEGPTLTGDAPDANPGAYSFSYTATPGDAPIARTVILSSSYVRGEGTPESGLPTGWAWNQTTATISNPSASGNLAITLNLRTYDTNGLFDDHSDIFSVSDSFILITGQAKPLQDPMWASLVGPITSAVGIPTSTGADVAGSILGYFDGVIASVHEDGSRYSLDRGETFLSSTLSVSDDMGKLTGGPAGWMADYRNFNSYPANGFSADPTPITYTSRVSPDFNPVRTDASRYIEGYYYRAATQVMYRSADLIGGWELSSDGREFAGQLDAFKIVRFFDLAAYDGKLYACVAKNTNESNTLYQIRWRDFDAFYWPASNVVYEVAAADGGKCPMQLCVGNGELIAYCLGGGVLTSANSFSAWIDTGVVGPPAEFGEPRLMLPSWRIAYDRGRFYVIGYGDDGDKITSSLDGLTWEDPVTMPITGATCILRIDPSEESP